MTDAQTALARRAVVCNGWSNMGGMLCADGAWRGRVGDGWNWRTGAEVLPVLDDPATLGCLLASVREAWGMPTGITVSYSSDEGLWGVSWSGSTHGGWCGRGATEAEALVAALEDAP